MPTLLPRECRGCTRVFLPTHHRQRYCEGCRKPTTARRRDVTTESRVCRGPDCGHVFAPNNHLQLYCSKECMVAASKQRVAAARELGGGRPLPPEGVQALEAAIDNVGRRLLDKCKQDGAFGSKEIFAQRVVTIARAAGRGDRAALSGALFEGLICLLGWAARVEARLDPHVVDQPWSEAA